MTKQFTIAQFFLWLLVIALGLVLGAGLYETLVVNPLWASGPPDSVTAYYQHKIAYPQFALNPGNRFWIFLTPLTGLLAIATLLSSWRTPPEHRRWRIAGAGMTLIVTVFTFAWFVPNLIRLTSQGVMQMEADHITSLTNLWVGLNWLRAALISAGWLALLRALSLPPKPAAEAAVVTAVVIDDVADIARLET